MLLTFKCLSFRLLPIHLPFYPHYFNESQLQTSTEHDGKRRAAAFLGTNLYTF